MDLQIGFDQIFHMLRDGTCIFNCVWLLSCTIDSIRLPLACMSSDCMHYVHTVLIMQHAEMFPIHVFHCDIDITFLRFLNLITSTWT